MKTPNLINGFDPVLAVALEESAPADSIDLTAGHVTDQDAKRPAKSPAKPTAKAKSPATKKGRK